MIEGPLLLRTAKAGDFEVSILEWNWPSVVDYTSVETQLAVEMSLPPYCSSGAACFPDVDPDDFCMMGNVFIRFPNHVVRGRGAGGKIRLLRCRLGQEATEKLLQRIDPNPSLETLKWLLNIRSPMLHSVLSLVQRELEIEAGPNIEALASLGRLVEVAVSRVINESGADSENRAMLPDWRFKRIKERLSIRGGRTGVDDLAQACSMSTRQLQRQFSTLTGDNLSSYVRRFWIERAKEILIETDLPIGEVSKILNFSSLSTFSRAFYRATGMTASAFRKAAQSPPADRNDPSWDSGMRH